MDARTGCGASLDSAGIRLCGEDGDLCMLCEIDRQAAETARLRAELEEARRQAEAARKAEEDRRLAEAAELEAQGRAAEAEQVLEAPVHVAAPVVRAEAPKAEGTSARRKLSAKVVDLDALVRAVAAGRVPLTLIQPNQRALDALAQAAGDAFELPGCELVVETVIAARGR